MSSYVCNCMHCEVEKEQNRQFKMWGEQNHPDGSGGDHFQLAAENLKELNKNDVANDTVNWSNILLEEVYEALAEDDPVKLKKELTQAAAVIFTWIRCKERGKQ